MTAPSYYSPYGGGRPAFALGAGLTHIGELLARRRQENRLTERQTTADERAEAARQRAQEMADFQIAVQLAQQGGGMGPTPQVQAPSGRARLPFLPDVNLPETAPVDRQGYQEIPLPGGRTGHIMTPEGREQMERARAGEDRARMAGAFEGVLPEPGMRMIWAGVDPRTAAGLTIPPPDEPGPQLPWVAAGFPNTAEGQEAYYEHLSRERGATGGSSRGRITLAQALDHVKGKYAQWEGSGPNAQFRGYADARGNPVSMDQIEREALQMAEGTYRPGENVAPSDPGQDFMDRILQSGPRPSQPAGREPGWSVRRGLPPQDRPQAPSPDALPPPDSTRSGSPGEPIAPAGRAGNVGRTTVDTTGLADRARQLRRQHPDWTQQQIADELRRQDQGR